MMVSGKPVVELDRAPRRHRASAVLSKPFDFAEFTDIARRLLSVHAEIPRQHRPAEQRVRT